MKMVVHIVGARTPSQVRQTLRRARSLLSLLLLLPGTSAQAAPARVGQTAAQEASHATGTRVEIPSDLTKLDVRALIRGVAESERAMQPRRFEYTWTTKVTERELGKRGEVKKETVKIYEVYPVRGEFVRKLVSENGVTVSAQEAEKQFKKAVANLEKAARADGKRNPAAPPPAAGATADATGIPTFGFSNGFAFRSGLSTGEFSFAPWRILRAGEFFAPRRENRNGREVLVLDFRPRADFVPANDLQKPYARLGGRIWIDVADRALARLEAWPLMPETTGAPRPAKLAPSNAPSIIYEETRLPDGMWLESLVRIDTTAHKAVFNGVEVHTTKEVGDFKRFDTSAGDAKVESPKQQ